MDRAVFLFIIYTSIVASLLYLNNTIRKTNQTTVSSITKDSSFQGNQLGPGFYEFSVIDYNRFLAQNKSFILFFYNPLCESCISQSQLLQSQTSSLDLPILRVNYQYVQTSTEETKLAKLYRVKQVHTFIVVNRDSNPTQYKIGLQSVYEINKLIEKSAHK